MFGHTKRGLLGGIGIKDACFALCPWRVCSGTGLLTQSPDSGHAGLFPFPLCARAHSGWRLPRHCHATSLQQQRVNVTRIGRRVSLEAAAFKFRKGRSPFALLCLMLFLLLLRLFCKFASPGNPPRGLMFGLICMVVFSIKAWGCNQIDSLP